MDVSERTPRKSESDRPRLQERGVAGLRNLLSKNANRPKKQASDDNETEDILQKMAKKNAEIQRKFDIAQRDREEAAAVGASFRSSQCSTQASRLNGSYGAMCAQSQNKPETHSSEQNSASVKHARIMSPPSSQISGMSCRRIQSAGSACGPLPPKGRARIRPQSSHMAVVGNVGASTGSQASSQTSTISSRQLQSAGNAPCRLPSKGRGRVRAQPPSMAGAGNVRASTGPHATAHGRMTLTPTEQPGHKQTERDSDSDSLQTASFPKIESPSLQARKKPESNRFAGLRGALLGLVTEIHAKNETLKEDQSTLFSGHVQVVSKPNRTPTEQPGHNQSGSTDVSGQPQSV
ncbi:uncharacterized protein LOC135812709 [Sycon ciliatum]|uniref:uncharacterized protein LOC135812709 n=1 Tax=Sycon ciliatum TaxID=27933 RepID=UPI0031F668D9